MPRQGRRGGREMRGRKAGGASAPPALLAPCALPKLPWGRKRLNLPGFSQSLPRHH